MGTREDQIDPISRAVRSVIERNVWRKPRSSKRRNPAAERRYRRSWWLIERLDLIAKEEWVSKAVLYHRAVEEFVARWEAQHPEQVTDWSEHPFPEGIPEPSPRSPWGRHQDDEDLPTRQDL
jgi:hypothetical protein